MTLPVQIDVQLHLKDGRCFVSFEFIVACLFHSGIGSRIYCLHINFLLRKDVVEKRNKWILPFCISRIDL